MPKGIEVSRFDKYGGKKYFVSHVFAYTTLCSEFIFEDKIFPRSLEDTTLEWFFSLSNKSIHSFNELIDYFYNHFQIHMGPKMNLANLMTCKQKDNKNFTNFIV
jgi:hypothetical protein